MVQMTRKEGHDAAMDIMGGAQSNGPSVESSVPIGITGAATPTHLQAHRCSAGAPSAAHASPTSSSSPSELETAHRRMLIKRRAELVCPALTRGTTLDGTNLLVDRRSWLEVDDAKHRYGKHLRLYYDQWKAAGRPEGDFWRWLDERRWHGENQHSGLLLGAVLRYSHCCASG